MATRDTPFFADNCAALEDAFSDATDAVCEAEPDDIIEFLAKHFSTLAAANSFKAQEALTASQDDPDVPVVVAEWDPHANISQSPSPIVSDVPHADGPEDVNDPFDGTMEELDPPPALDPEPQPEPESADSVLACHLVFSATNSGCFFLQWAEGRIESAVEGALAAFVPRRDVPPHKLSRGGRQELCRDVGGPNVKKFYQGWVSFIKAADSFDSTMFFLRNLDAKPVAIHYNTESMGVRQLQMGHGLDFEGLRAVAVVPALSDAFDVKIMQTRLFKQAGERIGAAVSFDGGDGLPRSERASSPGRSVSPMRVVKAAAEPAAPAPSPNGTANGASRANGASSEGTTETRTGFDMD